MPLCRNSAPSPHDGVRAESPRDDTHEITRRFSRLRLPSSLASHERTDAVPAMLPPSRRDLIVVERLSRKVNVSSFATVMKAYLILKNRVAAQRANKEFQEGQRRVLPLWGRRSSRVALESPSHSRGKRGSLKGLAETATRGRADRETQRGSHLGSREYAESLPRDQASPKPPQRPLRDGESFDTWTPDTPDGVRAVGAVGRMKACQSLLEQRLGFLGFKSVHIAGDGNCQFRSCSWNMFGSEEHHRVVRARAVQHMREHREEYGVFFEADDFEKYLKNMSRSGTWGDELSVRAIADSFQCTIHIITSTDSNWYLRYDPQSAGGKSVEAVRHIFLTYISPIHYNAFTIDDLSASDSETTGAQRG
ncbi:UNVERIFIED_CONTAM: OTU family cysteine protease [Hammondia hammondi]|eukprot:XP_008883130.1 OTU family cysteine protease [Hammondia hammondi]